MEYEKADKVYQCCGKYFAPTNAVSKKGSKLYCPSCKKQLKLPLNVPKIYIIKM